MNINFKTPSPEALFIYNTAHWNDRYYVNDCLCGKELVGRTKSELMENFEFHIQNCETKVLMAK